jgi:hypothetical protein
LEILYLNLKRLNDDVLNDAWFYTSHEAHEGYVHHTAKPLIDLETTAWSTIDDDGKSEKRSISSTKSRMSSLASPTKEIYRYLKTKKVQRLGSNHLSMESLQSRASTTKNDSLARSGSKPLETRPSIIIGKEVWRVSDTLPQATMTPLELRSDSSQPSSAIKSKAKRIHIESEESPSETRSHIETYLSPLKLKAQRVPLFHDSSSEALPNLVNTTILMESSLVSPTLKKRRIDSLKEGEGVIGSPLKMAVRLTEQEVASDQVPFTKCDSRAKKPLRVAQKDEISKPMTSKKFVGTSLSKALADEKMISSDVGPSQKPLRVTSNPDPVNCGSHLTKIQTKVCSAPVTQVRPLLQ